MQSDKLFIDVFPEIIANTIYLDYIMDSKVTDIKLYKKSKRLELCISFNKDVPVDVITDLEDKLSHILNLSSIKINALINKPVGYIKPEQIKEGKSTRSADKPKKTTKSSSKKAIIGKPFDDHAVSIEAISQDADKVIIEGQIFRVEIRETKSGKLLVIFDITDYTASMTVKFFAKIDDAAEIQQKIKDGIYVKLRGNLQYDKYSREFVVFAIDIVQTESKPPKQDLADTKRVELHLHTQMSAMDGVTPVEKYIERAASWGHKAIAITDHGVVQAFPEAHDAAKKHKVKVIYGIECYIINDDAILEKSRSHHAIILARNSDGITNLYKIVSESHLNFFHKKPRVPKSLIKKYRDGLILGSACEAGELYTALLDRRSDSEVSEIINFYDYLEIQPLGNNDFLVRNGRAKSVEHLIDINKQIVLLGDVHKKPVVATCDVHFIDPEDEVYRRILMAGKGFTDADRQAPLYFRTTSEMLAEFEYLGAEKSQQVVIHNTNLIADMVEYLTPIPDGTFPPRIDGAEQEIKDLVSSRAKQVYGESLPEIVKQRIDKELTAIIENGFSVMYIIAQKLVQKSLSDGYLVGSRGSVGSSFVANLVGITEVNALPPHYVCEKCRYSDFVSEGIERCGFDLPDKQCPVCGEWLKRDGYNIPFETFLGFNGGKEPDIDLNFSGEYQPVAHKYVEELFGEKHVFRAGTIATIADKTAYGYVKNYFEDRKKTVNNAEINRLIKGCSGVKRTTGQHPGGIMIVPQDKEIYEFCPIQRPADDVSSSIITTHFDYHSISGRLLKLDVLGHDDPTVIKMLEDLTAVNARTIPIGDKEIMRLFSSTEPLGVKPEDINSEVGTLAIPEFGTKFVRQMLVDTRPTTFSELIRISGLSHGTNVWLGNAQDLIMSGTATLSDAICTRDDIMVHLVYCGVPPKTAFNIMEDVRKGKGLKQEYQDVMIENGVPSWYIDSCNKIKYMFPKAHAAAYVMMAFRIAWFKVHYPEAFYTAYFTVRASEFDAEFMMQGSSKLKQTIEELESKGNDLSQKEKNMLTILEVVNEMYARGIKFLPIDLYQSDAMRFKIENGKIRPPLNALQGLGVTAAQNIIEARKNGKFLSIDDIRIRAAANKSVIEVLQKYHCLEGMPQSNQLRMF